MTDNQADTTDLLDAALPRLLAHVEKKLNWGPTSTWSGTDFQNLSDRIFAATDERLSVTTLKRAWGRTTQGVRPSTTTLNILARFAGSEHWREYIATPADEAIITSTEATDTKAGDRKTILLAATGVAFALLLFFGISAFADEPTSPPIDPDSVTFSVEKVTSGIPNTVVFRYDLGGQAVDTLELQQTWDDSRRILLDPTAKLITATYLSPGYFSAKLVANGKIIKTHNLYLPSNGFEAFVMDADADDFRPLSHQFWQLNKDGFAVSAAYLPEHPASQLQLANLLPKPIISSDSFTFHTAFRMDGPVATDQCHGLTIILTAAEEVYVFMLGKRGCAGYFGLFLAGQEVSGTNTDLSDMAFATDEWNDLTIDKAGSQLHFNINGKSLAFPLDHPDLGGFGGVRFFVQTPLLLREVYFEDRRGRVGLLAGGADN